MSHADTAVRGTVANRPTASRKLLSRKAAATAAADIRDSEALEDSFPADVDDAPIKDGLIEPAAEEISPPDDAATATNSADLPAQQPDAEPQSLTLEPATATGPALPAATATWSEADESAFQLLTARRKAAGHQRRGRDAGGQVLRVGSISPNPGTVAATIAALVAERGTVTRSDLVAAMAKVTFSHPKARPSDRGWCAGYIAGGVRDGFIEVVSAGSPEADSGAEGAM